MRTLVYADIFDYPLTSREVHKFLIADKPHDFDSVQKTLERMSASKKTVSADKTDRFYFLAGCSSTVVLREKREKISQKKLKIARKIARMLKLLPTIKLIGITGRLAMENSEEEGDIDFLIVTSANRLWLTRFLTIVFLELLRKRRRPRDINVRDKICLNMFLDERFLSLPAKERDLYTAHEIVQMKLLWDKDKTYQKFLKANERVREYLPNATRKKDTKILGYEDTRKIFNFQSSSRAQVEGFSIFNFFERIALYFQFLYMKRRQTTEVATPHRALFHPKSAKGWILQEYQRRVAKLSLC